MNDNIFKISKNKIRARALLEMAKERLGDINKETKTYKIIEGYYEVIKELITVIMYIDGFKTLSHKSLVEYLFSNYKQLDRQEFILTDELRILRNNIMYYGQKVDPIFLKNRETKIRKIINKLLKICKEKLKD